MEVKQKFSSQNYVIHNLFSVFKQESGLTKVENIWTIKIFINMILKDGCSSSWYMPVYPSFEKLREGSCQPALHTKTLTQKRSVQDKKSRRQKRQSIQTNSLLFCLVLSLKLILTTNFTFPKIGFIEARNILDVSSMKSSVQRMMDCPIRKKGEA